MKKINLLLILMLMCSSTFAQDIVGQWTGQLNTPKAKLRIVFNITKTPKGYSATMDSPDQYAKGIPVTSTTLKGNMLVLNIQSAQIEFQGKVKGKEIKGMFNQGMLNVPMTLVRTTNIEPEVKRPQEPSLPYPYNEQQVVFENKAAFGVRLSGTLTTPKDASKSPVVILISGSGPQDRDESLMGHRPFFVLADYLTRNGIAVLRYDDRGYGRSTGNHTTATTEDFASDVKAAVEFLKGRKEIDATKIGLMGHSEGGIIAPMVAQANDDIDFIVLLAGTGIPGDEIIMMQVEWLLNSQKASPEVIEKTRNTQRTIMDYAKTQDPELYKQAVELLVTDIALSEPNKDKQKKLAQDVIKQMDSPWMKFFLTYNPVEALKRVKCPVLAVNGTKDMQVPSKQNLEVIESTLKLSGNKDVTIIEFDGLNHLFQECATGSPDEYAKIEQTFSPNAMKEITEWIIKRVK